MTRAFLLSPSDNPTDVQLPADLSSSPLPPIETGVQVLEVAPPEGWRPSEDGSIGAFVELEELCARNPTDTRCFPAKDLDDQAGNDKDGVDAPTGGDGNNTPSPDDSDPPTKPTVNESIEAILPSTNDDDMDSILRTFEYVAKYIKGDELTLTEKTELYQKISDGILNGDIGKEDLETALRIGNSLLSNGEIPDSYEVEKIYSRQFSSNLGAAEIMNDFKGQFTTFADHCGPIMAGLGQLCTDFGSGENSRVTFGNVIPIPTDTFTGIPGFIEANVRHDNNAVFVTNETDTSYRFAPVEGNHPFKTNGYIEFSFNDVDKDTVEFQIDLKGDFVDDFNRTAFNRLGGNAFEEGMWNELLDEVENLYEVR